MGNSSFYSKSSKSSKKINESKGSKRKYDKNAKKNEKKDSNTSKNSSKSSSSKSSNDNSSKASSKSKNYKKKDQNSTKHDDSDSDQKLHSENFYISDPNTQKQFDSYSFTNNEYNGVPNDWWLYDTGSSQHISNDRSLFKTFYNSSKLPEVLTGAGPIRPHGRGTVQLVLSNRNNNDKFTLILENTLYIPNFPINVVSGLNHFRSGGKINGHDLVSSRNQVITTFNPSKSGFFLYVANRPEPDLSFATIQKRTKNDLGNYPKRSKRSNTEGKQLKPLSGIPNPAKLPGSQTKNSNISSNSYPISEIPTVLESPSFDFTETDFEDRNPWTFLSEVLKARGKPDQTNYVFITYTQQWHNRLGHPSFEALQKASKSTTGIDSSKLIKADLQCEDCLKAKFTRIQKKSNENRATFPL